MIDNVNNSSSILVKTEIDPNSPYASTEANTFPLDFEDSVSIFDTDNMEDTAPFESVDSTDTTTQAPEEAIADMVEDVNVVDFTPPENVTFGGLDFDPVVPAPAPAAPIAPIPLVPVPIHEGQEKVEGVVKGFAVGSPTYLNSFRSRLKSNGGKISTGIPELDFVTGGGWANGLNCVAAAPNVGKTTILIQSACAMAQRGVAVVYITNDMREMDLTAKVLSGISYTLQKEKCMRIGQILDKDTFELHKEHMEEVFKRAEETMKYLHIRDLIYDLDFDKACAKNPVLAEMSKLERIFYIYAQTYKEVVFIADSLQQIAGYTNSGKEGVDSQLRHFKQLSRKYDVPIIMVSTLNRGGYSKKGEIEYADFKESGNIEYDCDTILTMIPKFFTDPTPAMDMKLFKMSEKRDIIITSKKCRDCGERDAAMTLYAPGCTFIPYEDNGEGSSAPVAPKKGKTAKLPPLGSLDWGLEQGA